MTPIVDEDEHDPIPLDSREIPARLLPLWCVLIDGGPHGSRELRDASGITRKETLRKHLQRLRKVIRPRGLDVMLRTLDKRALAYQLVRLINPGAE